MDRQDPFLKASRRDPAWYCLVAVDRKPRSSGEDQARGPGGCFRDPPPSGGLPPE